MFISTLSFKLKAGLFVTITSYHLPMFAKNDCYEWFLQRACSQMHMKVTENTLKQCI